jgi:D-alanyl-D-alanine carboxypeptidase (penicillin-binding protein 5/6)
MAMARGPLPALVVALAVAAALPARAAPPPADVAFGPPHITADAAVLVDAGSGRVLWGKAAWEPRAPASTTKMMTALVALERGNPEAVITVSRAAAATPGSSAQLRPGDRYTLGELLEALLLRSGNDAAVAIAEHIAGSVPAFATLMNEKAKALGLEATHFVNPHGLTAPFHFSSAYDLALIARAGLAVPAFASIVRSAERQVQGYDAQQHLISRSLTNTNRLLFTYGWVDGVKTGTTAAAGNCLVASGTRGGLRLIAVVLHSDDRWGDAVRLLEWGFTHFSYLRPARAGQVLRLLPLAGARRAARLPVVAAATLAVPVSLDELPRVRVRLRLRPGLRAPVAKGEAVGHEVLLVGDQPLETIPLVAGASVPRAPWWLRLWEGLRGR